MLPSVHSVCPCPQWLVQRRLEPEPASHHQEVPDSCWQPGPAADAESDSNAAGLARKRVGVARCPWILEERPPATAQISYRPRDNRVRVEVLRSASSCRLGCG